MSIVARVLLLLLALASLAGGMRLADHAAERADLIALAMVTLEDGGERDEVDVPGLALDDDGERHIGPAPAMPGIVAMLPSLRRPPGLVPDLPQAPLRRPPRVLS